MNITILDGGVGQELVARSAQAPTSLWSARVMLNNPQLLRAVHEDFFRAGAQIATANTYAVQHSRLLEVGMDDRFEALHNVALNMAQEALLSVRHEPESGQAEQKQSAEQRRSAETSEKEAPKKQLRIAGSIGPLGWSYRPDLTPEHSKAVARFREIAAIHVGKADILLGETITSLAELRAIVEATAGFDKPLWCALSVQDDNGNRLRSGEPLEDAFTMLGHAQAVLLNCSIPEAISKGLATLPKAALPFGAYANGFTRINDSFAKPGATVNMLAARINFTPESYSQFAVRWANMGATIIGGCCKVGPLHIHALCAALQEAGYTL